MNDKNSLYKYFEKNPKYHMKSDFYETEKGYKIRSEWCQFLNNTKIFKYKN